jgi:hypothetical protein
LIMANLPYGRPRYNFNMLRPRWRRALAVGY